METALTEARNKALLDFIIGMLTNLGASPASAIHRNLQLFSAALPYGYEYSEEDLRGFLDLCVNEGKLDVDAEEKFFVADS